MLRPPSRPCLAAALLVAGVIALGCAGGVPPPPPPPLGQTDFSLTSAEFVSEYKANQNAFHSKYGGKVVELTGKIVSFSTDAQGEAHFYLEGPNPANLDQAICQMAERLPWKKATPGQTVTVKGRGDTLTIPRLENCEILKVTGPDGARLSADEFVKRTRDRELFKRKDRPRFLIVHGEIARLAGPPNNTGLFLKTQDRERKALIHFSPRDFQRLNVASWKPGQKIEVVGYDSSNPNTWGWLAECLPMDEPK